MQLRLAVLAALYFAAMLPAGARPLVLVTNCCNGGSSVSVINAASRHEIAGIPAGTNTMAITTSPDGHRAYAANFGSNTVTVIDTAAHQAIRTLPMSLAPIALTVSTDSQTLYAAVCTFSDPVLGCQAGAVDFIDVASGHTKAQINVNGVPNDLKATADGTLLIVAANPSLVEIDTARKLVVKTINAPSAAPAWVVLTPDGRYALTTGSGLWQFELHTGNAKSISSTAFFELGISPDGTLLYALSLSNLDTIARSTGNILSSLPVAQLPQGLAVSPDGKRAYVSDAAASSVAIVDLIHERVIATAMVANLPAGLAVTPDSREIYVSNSDSSTISALDEASNALAGQTEAGARPRRIAATPDGRRAYVANYSGHTVSVIDLTKIAKIGDIDLGHTAYNVVMSPDGRHCYANFDGEGVAFIDTASNRVVASLRYGPQGIAGDLSDLAVSPDGQLLYALDAQQGFGGVRIVDTRTAKLAGGITVSPLDGLSTMTMTPDGRKLYVSAYFAKTIDIVDIKSRRVEEKVSLTVSPEYLVASPDGRRIYVVLYPNIVAVLDVSTEKIVASVRIPVNYGIGAIAVTPDGSRVYATGSDIYAIDTRTMKITHDTSVGADTWGVTVTR